MKRSRDTKMTRVVIGKRIDDRARKTRTESRKERNRRNGAEDTRAGKSKCRGMAIKFKKAARGKSKRTAKKKGTPTQIREEGTRGPARQQSKAKQKIQRDKQKIHIQYGKGKLQGASTQRAWAKNGGEDIWYNRKEVGSTDKDGK